MATFPPNSGRESGHFNGFIVLAIRKHGLRGLGTWFPVPPDTKSSFSAYNTIRSAFAAVSPLDQEHRRCSVRPTFPGAADGSASRQSLARLLKCVVTA